MDRETREFSKSADSSMRKLRSAFHPRSDKEGYEVVEWLFTRPEKWWTSLKKRRNCRRKGWPKCTMMKKKKKEKETEGVEEGRRSYACVGCTTTHLDKRTVVRSLDLGAGRMKRAKLCRALEVSFPERVVLAWQKAIVASTLSFRSPPLLHPPFFSSRDATNANPSRVRTRPFESTLQSFQPVRRVPRQRNFGQIRGGGDVCI